MYHLIIELYVISVYAAATRQDVCAQLTNVDANFWANNPDTCDVLLARRAARLVMIVIAVVFAIWGNILICCVMSREVWIRPLLRLRVNGAP